MTPKMIAALRALRALEDSRGGLAYTPNQIGIEMGQPKGRYTRSGSSPTHARLPSEGSGISAVLKALTARGLIESTIRDDGWSGVAYRLTAAGRLEAGD
jgi:hypothetical protein